MALLFSRRSTRSPFAFNYVAGGGGRVIVQRCFKPHKVLGVATDASRGDIKSAFGIGRRDVAINSRQQRVMASLSYYALTTRTATCFSERKNGCEYEIVKCEDIFLLAAAGDTATLMAKVSRNKALLTQCNEHNHTVLYLAARAGFYDTTEGLLKAGALVNHVQVDGSTALHGASFYGQRIIVQLLLQYGADPAIINKWGHTAMDEAGSSAIREVMRNFKDDNISAVASSLIGKGLARRVRFIHHEGKVVGKEIVRNEEKLDSRTRQKWSAIQTEWETAWHGTKSSCLESIFQHGLVASGMKLPDGSTIKPPSNHYKLGERHFDTDNWGNAIFLSPSILYSSHACYAERVTSESEGWCVVVKASVEPSSYKAFDPTVYNYEPIDGEPENPEYKVSTPDVVDSVMRVESARNVVVTSVIFISLKFLETRTKTLTYEEVRSCFV